MTEGTILVTGGAGYIGSHITKDLLEQSHKVIVLDNLSNGYITPIRILKSQFKNLEFIKGNLSNKEKLTEIFQNYTIDAVMHLAAKINVEESIEKPNLYHQENYLNSINLVEAMIEKGVKKLIFSSTAAVYGNPKYLPINEDHPTNPESPYGQTKLDFEKYLTNCENLNFIILRYFNVGGCDPDGQLGKSHLQGKDLIENIMKVALGKKETLEVFGSDYDTNDGTAIRDFIHVEDIAQAHLLALKKLSQNNKEIFNLASEKGFSVKEIINKAKNVIGKDIPIIYSDKREGDIAISIADAEKAKKLLGWRPKFSNLEQIIQTDWSWRKTHPMGYTK